MGERGCGLATNGVFTSHYGVITIFVHGSTCLFLKVFIIFTSWIILIKGMLSSLRLF